MKILSVKAENLRARDFDLKLTPVTVICGGNDAGKTAVIDAVKVALMKYKPGLGKQGIATMDLAGDDKLEMRSFVELEGGKKAYCNFKRKPDGGTECDAGSDVSDVEILDMDEFFNRPAAEQLSYFMSRINTSDLGFSDSDLIDHLTQLEALPAAEGLKGRDEMLKVVNQSIVRRDSEKTSLQSWLGQLQDSLKSELKDLNSRKKNSAGASVTFRGSGNKPKSQKDVIDAKRKELDVVNGHLTILLGQKTAFDSLGSQRKKLEEKAAIPIPEGEVKFRKELSDLEKTAAEYVSKSPALDAELTVMRNKAKVLQDSVKALQDVLGKAEREMAAIKDQCVHCGQPIPPEKIAEQKESMRVDCMDINARITKDQESLKKVISDGHSTKAKLEASKEKDSEHTELKNKIECIKDQLEEIDKAKKKVDQAKAELKGLSAVKEPDSKVIKSLEEKQDALNTSLKELTTAELAFDEWTSNEKKRKDLEKDGLALHARIEIYKQSIAIVADEQEKLISHAFDSIIEPARRITDGILPGALGYRNGTIGIATENNWIKYKTFAGNWKTIAFAALAVALARQSPVKVVCIDELGTIESSRKQALIQRLIDLTKEGFIDNAIGCDIDKTSYASITDENFSLIEI